VPVNSEWGRTGCPLRSCGGWRLQHAVGTRHGEGTLPIQALAVDTREAETLARSSRQIQSAAENSQRSAATAWIHQRRSRDPFDRDCVPVSKGDDDACVICPAEVLRKRNTVYAQRPQTCRIRAGVVNRSPSDCAEPASRAATTMALSISFAVNGGCIHTKGS
jgi:hypothetical protein